MVVFKGFSPNEYFEWEDSHPLCSNALSPSGSVMITITITITVERLVVRIIDSFSIVSCGIFN